LDSQERVEDRRELFSTKLAMAATERNTFSKQSEVKQRGPLAEFCGFILHNKKWWLTPIIIVLVLVGFLAVLGGSGVAPFIYTLF